jgi:hypothetical protein
MKARLHFRLRVTHSDGGFEEFVAWKIPSGPRYPDGVRYRFAFVPAGHVRPAVLYDNHHPKGHHKHLEGREIPSIFIDIRRLVADFRADVAHWKSSPR